MPLNIKQLTKRDLKAAIWVERRRNVKRRIAEAQALSISSSEVARSNQAAKARSIWVWQQHHRVDFG